MGNLINKIVKNFLIEEAGVSFDARVWTPIIIEELNKLPKNEVRVIIDCQEYPEQFKRFSADYIVVDLNDWTNGYLDRTSGYDADGNYVVHILVLKDFVGSPYMYTILNHEGKHAYQDYKRITSGGKGIFSSKEVINIYTDDFIKIVKGRVPVSPIFQEIFKGYYLLTDLELEAFKENVYDRDRLNDYKRMVSGLKNYQPRVQESPKLEKEWQILKSLDLPFIKKYKSYQDFIQGTTDYFKKRSEEVIKKINKLEYVHGLNENRLLNEQVLCHLVSPLSNRTNGYGTGYISNEEANALIDKIERSSEMEIKDPNILKRFKETIQEFRREIKDIDTNNDTIDTNLHKLRDLINC